jgi:hypothetical protein
MNAKPDVKTNFNRVLITGSAVYYIYFMTITQTINVPTSRWLTIEVPPEVPVGPVILTITPAEDPFEEFSEDQYLLALAKERIKNDTGVTFTTEETLAKDGLTLADIDAMEDVEVE